MSAYRKLFSESFPETNNKVSSSLKHYDWKFRQCPASPASYEYVARNEIGLLGYYAALPYRYKVGDDEALCGMVCDVMTSPGARGQGVFTKLGHYATASLKDVSVDFVTGFPIRPEVIPGHLKVGWKIVDDLPIYIKICRFRSLIDLPILNPIFWLADALNSFCYFLLYAYSSRDVAFRVELDDLLKDEQYEIFRKKWQTEQMNCLIKNAPFLKWRTSAPGTEYNIFVQRNSNDIVAIAVLRETQLRGIPSLAILDLMKVGCANLQPLHSAIHKFAKTRKVALIATMISRRWAKRYQLIPNGFIRTHLVFKLIVKNLSSRFSDEKVYTANRWHTMWIDSDDL